MESAPRRGGEARDRTPLHFSALVILLAVFSIAPLTYPGWFQTQTGLNAVYNLMDLHSHPSAVWSPTFGAGFDLFRMDGPLPYLAGELFHLIGFSFPDAVKLVYALAFLASGIGMFALARYIFRSDAAGLVAALVYLYFPYHIALVYVRGAFGEAAAWAILPFALLALVREQRSPRYLVMIAALFALLTITQPGLAILFGIFALSFLVALAGWRRLRQGAAAGVAAGWAIGGVLLLPGILQNGAVVRRDGFTSAFVYPFQMLTASWGSAVPQGKFLEQFPYQIGIAALGLAIVGVALVLRPVEGSRDEARRVVLTGVAASAVAALLMTPAAAPLWEWSLAKALVQYPFQLFAPVAVGLALASASILVSELQLAQTPMLAALSAIPIIAVYSYLAPDFNDFLPSRPPVAVFNQDEVALLDAAIVRPPGVLRHGATVELDMQWQALREVDHDYTVFVHVVDENGQTWGSQDSKPQDGALPTIQWTAGRVISDTHTVRISLDGPPEGYHLEVGLYTAATGERAVADNGATEIRVEENK